MEQLRSTVAQLQRMLTRMQFEREQAARRRRKRLLMIAVPISLGLHVLLLLYLALMYRPADGDGTPGPEGVQFALVQDVQLTEDSSSELSDLSSDDAVDLSATDLDSPEVPLDAAMPSDDLTQSDAIARESLGGSGDGLDGGDGLSTGGSSGGTSYFGVAGQGTRFAFIVDRSGSMGYRNRMTIASRELINAIEGLPDFAHFYVLFFSSDILEPPMQDGWMQARRNNVAAVTRWINNVDPGGGTLPRTSFQNVFALDVLPDVIYFMTDGIIAESALTAEEITSLNRGRKRVVIHTITFGDQGSEELMRRIARESGGTYRYIPDRGDP